MLRRSKVRGQIDGLKDGFLHGWIHDGGLPEKSLSFHVFFNNNYLGYSSGVFYRPDLHKLGFGRGFHGFKFPVPEHLQPDLNLSQVEIFAPGHAAIWLRVEGGAMVADRTAGRTKAARMRRFQIRLRTSQDVSCQCRKLSPEAAQVTAVLSRREVYRDAPSCSYMACDFTEFLRRLGLAKGYEAGFRKWYVYEYVHRLDPRFIPMSAQERRFLKQEVELEHRPNLKFEVPRLFRFLFPGPARQLETTFLSYWWVLGGGRHLNLQYAVSDDEMRRKLEAPIALGRDASGAFAAADLIFLLENKLVHPLSLLFPQGRERAAKLLRLCSPQRLLQREMQMDRPSPRTGDSVSAENSEKERVQFVGPFDRLLGLGEASRRILNALEVTGVPFRPVCSNEGIQSASTGDVYETRLTAAEINILQLNLEQIPEFLLKEGDRIFNSYNIVVPFWELSAWSEVHWLGLALIDEIWCASRFIHGLGSNSQRPVVYIGMPARGFGEYECSREAGPAGFTFLTSFDAFSWPQRKNAIQVIEAFCDAFGVNENVRLIVKTQNADRVHTLEQRQAWERICEAAGADPRITVINETYPPHQQRELVLSTDCLVSLHRSEGLGLDILDCLATGVPVVATAYSGNMDACGSENTWLVSYDLIPVSAADYVFVNDGLRWAQPVQSDAITAIREVFENSRLRLEKSRRGVDGLDPAKSLNRVSRRIKERLCALLGV